VLLWSALRTSSRLMATVGQGDTNEKETPMQSNYTHAPPARRFVAGAATARYNERQARAYEGLVGSLLRRGAARRRANGGGSSPLSTLRQPEASRSLS
jgi:hypothetical protein